MSARAESRSRSDPVLNIHPIRRTIRYYVSRIVVSIITRAWIRFDLEGRERLPDGPAIYAFNHLSWADPFVLMATMPLKPRLSFFGPREEDMRAGGRNRVMLWTGSAIPYKPGKNDLLEATRRVGAVIAKGGVLAIAGEGRIGADRGPGTATQRWSGLLRPPVTRPAGPRRHQRDELAALRCARADPDRRADRGPGQTGSRRSGGHDRDAV